MRNAAVILVIAIAVSRMNGMVLHHITETKGAKGLPSSQLVLNTSRIVPGSLQHPNQILNWTRIEVAQPPQPKEKQIANKWLGSPTSNSVVVERQIIRKVYSRPIPTPKPALTPDPSKKVPFAYTNIDNNNNWTAFDYTSVQMNNLIKQENQTVTCPKDRPFYDGSRCKACADGAYFDMDTKQCGWPTPSRRFDPNVHKFMNPQNKKTRLDAPYLQYNGLSKNQYKEKRAQQQANPNEQCPHERPYYDGVTCIQCVMPFPVFNVESLRCERCESGHFYQKKLHGCYLPETTRLPLSIRQSLSGIIS